MRNPCSGAPSRCRACSGRSRRHGVKAGGCCLPLVRAGWQAASSQAAAGADLGGLLGADGDGQLDVLAALGAPSQDAGGACTTPNTRAQPVRQVVGPEGSCPQLVRREDATASGIFTVMQ